MIAQMVQIITERTNPSALGGREPWFLVVVAILILFWILTNWWKNI